MWRLVGQYQLAGASYVFLSLSGLGGQTTSAGIGVTNGGCPAITDVME